MNGAPHVPLAALFGFEGFAMILVPLLPALIALYFLKLKRREVPVSSTYLWKRSLEDLQVNSPFQKLRRSLLLLLQLLILLALILAASRPVLRGAGAGGRNLLLLIDNSASMNTLEEGGTRLELARRQAEGLVEGMVGGDRMAVIAFSSRSRVVEPLTADRVALRRAIGSIPATALSTDLLQALRTAEAIARSLPAAEVYLVGDGAYGTLGSLTGELERFALKFLAVGKGSENLGITELDVRRSFGIQKRVELFAAVHNFSEKERKVVLGVYRDERILSAAELVIPAGRSSSYTFDATRFLPEGETAPALLRLEIDQGGLLKDDDQALVRLAPPERLSVLVVGAENPFLDRVLGVEPLVDARRVSLAAFVELSRAGKLRSDPARVLIFDRAAGPEPPDRPALYIGCYPPVAELLGREAGGGAAAGAGKPVVVKGVSIVDWDRAHPVNRFLAFADLSIEESLAFSGGRGYRSLIDTADRSIAGTVSLSAEGRPPVAALILGFDIQKTNWPWLHSFPIFFGNALDWLGRAAGSETSPRYRTGEPLVYYPGERKLESPAFRDPAGRDHPASVERGGELTFSGTELAGLYQLRAGGEVLETYPVSLLSGTESDITPRKEIHFGAQVVESQAATQETRDLWKWFVLAALFFLGLEWWIYNKRMHL
jgi:hypothetical protein